MVSGLRLWSAPDHVRLVFDLSAPVEHQIFSLAEPDRLVVDLSQARLERALPELRDNRLIRRVRSGVREGKDLRVVFDLRHAVRPKSFLLAPNRQYGHRLVVDVYDSGTQAGKQPTKAIKSFNSDGSRSVVVAIDAGHGGEDVGAIGKGGTYEKDVVLAIAQRLGRLIDEEAGMEAVLIRDGDYYLQLRRRMELAREHRADFFVSIHADAFRDSRVRGASVYTLSHRGASSEAARWLAERENSSDMIGGVSLDDKDSVLASVLLDLSQAATLQESVEAADVILAELKAQGKAHKKTVQQAGFMVLKSPDIPSVLVEVAFITNPEEERRLKDPGSQQRVADALKRGIKQYFTLRPPPGTLMAKLRPKNYRINPGDTLSEIAARYDVSLAQLRSVNGLKSDTIRVGQVLVLPES